MIKQYGVSSVKSLSSELDRHIENLKLRGYTELPGVLAGEKIKALKDSCESVYKTQKEEFGEENLEKISELDVARIPFAYDEEFLSLITEPKVHEILKLVLGEFYILQLQNSIINRPNKEHHQSSWHRDIPYQEYTLSKPISVNVFYCLSPFNNETGGTILLPYSHKFDNFPSVEFLEENQFQPALNAGDVVIFDSWIYHKAGYNSSDINRYGVNHVFTSPILKQQIDLPKMLDGKYADNDLLNVLLGYRFQVEESVLDFRKKRIK